MSRLIQERRDMEAKFQEDMLAKKEEFAKILEDIRDADAEEYNNLKVRLEMDMQTLEQYHATMQVFKFYYISPLSLECFTNVTNHKLSSCFHM